MKKMMLIPAVAVLGAAAWFAGPRVAVDTTVRFDATQIGADVDAWLRASEARFGDIRPDHEKRIVWAYPASRARTPLAIVYVHGFSASRHEIRPVPDEVAAALGANLFFTRLAGHGRDGPAMAEASVNDWINDYAEAIAVGRRIGEKAIVVATSTGAALAIWAATRPELARDVAGMVLISPNLGVRAGGSRLLTGPWGRQIARLVLGAERGFEPLNGEHARYWTTRYPTAALLPMAALTDLAAGSAFENIETPALFILSDEDAVVRPELSRAARERWGAASRLLAIDGADDPSNHVIAGDALSPSTTAAVGQAIVEWVRALPDR